MPPELIRDGKLDRQATADALRNFLEDIVRASGLELKVNVRAVPSDGNAAEGDAAHPRRTHRRLRGRTGVLEQDVGDVGSQGPVLRHRPRRSRSRRLGHSRPEKSR